MASTDMSVFNAIEKSTDGKGVSRALRREGKVPAVMYGADGENVSFALELREIERELRKKNIFSRLFAVKVNGKEEQALVKDIQFHPVKDLPMHVDFLRVNDNSRVTVSVPVHFINHDKSMGLKRGGSLNVVSHRINVVCAPANIPTRIDVDLTGLKAKDSVATRNVAMPEGVELARKNEYTVCTVLPPRGMTVAEANREE